MRAISYGMSGFRCLGFRSWRPRLGGERAKLQRGAVRAGGDGAAHGLVDVPGESRQGVAQGRLGGPATGIPLNGLQGRLGGPATAALPGTLNRCDIAKSN